MSGEPICQQVPPLRGEIFANARRTVVVAAYASHMEMVLRRLSVLHLGGAFSNHIITEPLASDRHFLSDLEQYPAARRAIYDLRYLLFVKHGFEIENSTVEIDYAEDLRDWRRLYARHGKLSKSLNKTLDAAEALPAIVLLPLLACIELKRPITDSGQLRFLLMALAGQSGLLHAMTGPIKPTRIGSANARPGAHRLIDLIQAASFEEIQHAWDLYSRHRRLRRDRKLLLPDEPMRGSMYFRSFIIELYDYAESTPANLVSWTKKTLAWHDALARRGVPNALTRKKGRSYDAATRLPEHAFTLPEGNWRYLQTVFDLRCEAETMQHCVSGYVKKALAGKCFLFHFSDGKSEATVEYDAMGLLVQARGPRNQRNSATRLIEKEHPRLRRNEYDRELFDEDISTR